MRHETAVERRERIVKAHSEIFNNPNVNLNSRGKQFKIRPMMLLAVIVAVMVVYIIFSSRGTSDSFSAETPFCVFGGRIYVVCNERDSFTVNKSMLAELLGEIDACINKNNFKTTKFADFTGSAFDLGKLYSLKDYPNDEWLAVQYAGKYILLRHLPDSRP